VISRNSLLPRFAAAVLSALFASVVNGQPADSASAREAALFDPTGYWVSVVSEEWRWRMLRPPKGDYSSIPLNAEGRRVADRWDPTTQSDNDRCLQYGAAGGMRIPGRLHIEWDDANTLRIDFDAGMQTRMLQFNAEPASRPRSPQGDSHGRWHKQLQSRGLAFGAAVPGGPGGTLIAETDNLTGGYLRSNGVPYSENTTVTEYINRFSHRNGNSWLLVTSVVEDPVFLTEPFVVSTHFRQEPDDSKWMPVPCERLIGGR